MHDKKETKEGKSVAANLLDMCQTGRKYSAEQEKRETRKSYQPRNERGLLKMTTVIYLVFFFIRTGIAAACSMFAWSIICDPLNLPMFGLYDWFCLWLMASTVYFLFHDIEMLLNSTDE